ncbi:hypothetical protein AJ80_09057 [Polytolypa hystricis UAMH7299]|uniref:Major facilitator superfamily (MFS) profile domain-containing protein n=1 Tax=Polytolypa hystricis (strain UAMH7299) TaxID=1447883 RepID=A0A2B7WXE5_POLH7|nr:hypothetical protein AJ80_09057 [Polytolypa hystricis UAMH7299]
MRDTPDRGDHEQPPQDRTEGHETSIDANGSPAWVDTQDLSNNEFPLTRLLIIIGSLAFTLFVSLIDQNSVSTALPEIAKDLNAFDSISWVGTSFLIANTSFQLINGRLSDIFGRKACLLICLALLAIGDLLCGFAKSAIQLYIFRGLAGIGAGGINSLTMIIFADLTTLQQRGKYQGLLETNIALGNGVGPLIGGAFAQSSATWRWAFWFVVPVTCLAAFGILSAVPKTQVQGSIKEKILLTDFWGMILSLGAAIIILIPVSGGGSTYEWNSAIVISLLCVGGILVIVFILVEWKVARVPVIPFRVFERTSAKILFTHNFITGIVYYMDLYYIPLYYQIVLGYAPLMSGVLVLPLILSFSASSTTAGLILSKIGRCNPVVRIGYLLWTAGAGGRIAFGENTSLGVIVVCLMIEGLGVGFSFQPVMIALLSNTKKEDRAVVTGLRNFLRTMGGAVGLAIGAAVLNNLLTANIPSHLAAKDAPMELASMLNTLSPSDKAVVVAAYMKGLKVVFCLGCPLMGICLLSSAFLTDIPLATAYATNSMSQGPACRNEDVEKTACHRRDDVTEPAVAQTPNETS